MHLFYNNIFMLDPAHGNTYFMGTEIGMADVRFSANFIKHFISEYRSEIVIYTL